MPLKYSRHAPEKFSGSHSKVQGFLEHYELLLDQHNVTSDEHKCELILRYCSSKVKEFIQVLSSYMAKDWIKLKKDMMKYYDADLDVKRYKEQDLIKLVKSCREKRIENLSAWHRYARKFIPIAGWLKKKGKISNAEYATYYWIGIPRKFRHKLEDRLMARDPTRSLEEPFSIEEINQSAEVLLQRYRFDSMFAGSDSESDGDENEDDNEDEDEDSELDSDNDVRYIKQCDRKKVKFARRTREHESVSDSDDEESSDDERFRSKGKHSKSIPKNSKKNTQNSDKKEPEIKSLIKEINSMSADDPGYASLVFKAVKLDSDVLYQVKAPVFPAKPQVSSRVQVPPESHPVHVQPTTPLPRPYQSPGPFQNTARYQQMQPGLYQQTQAEELQKEVQRTITCWGCGKEGHPMTRCPEIADMVKKGIIKRDVIGRIRHVDGALIQKFYGENLVDAVHREQPPRHFNQSASHLVQVMRHEDLTESNGDDMMDCRANADIKDRAWRKTEKLASTKKKEVTDRLYIPPHRKSRLTATQGKENEAPGQRDVPAVPKHVSIPQPNVPVPISPNAFPQTYTVPNPVPEPDSKPVNENPERKPAVQKPRYTTERDDPRIEDVSNGRERRDESTATSAKPGMSKNEDLLSGEEMCGPFLHWSEQNESDTEAQLIEIEMQSNGQNLKATIDTGSEVNVISQDLYLQKINRPVDYCHTMKIMGVNGNNGTLTGLVKNVKLNCGEVSTSANLWISQQGSCSLLLGRPWQQSNLVTIDERKSGTYLIFKDPIDQVPYCEVLAAHDPTRGQIIDVPEWKRVRTDPVPAMFVGTKKKENENTVNYGDLMKVESKRNSLVGVHEMRPESKAPATVAMPPKPPPPLEIDPPLEDEPFEPLSQYDPFGVDWPANQATLIKFLKGEILRINKIRDEGDGSEADEVARFRCNAQLMIEWIKDFEEWERTCVPLFCTILLEIICDIHEHDKTTRPSIIDTYESEIVNKSQLCYECTVALAQALGVAACTDTSDSNCAAPLQSLFVADTSIVPMPPEPAPPPVQEQISETNSPVNSGNFQETPIGIHKILTTYHSGWPQARITYVVIFPAGTLLRIPDTSRLITGYDPPEEAVSTLPNGISACIRARNVPFESLPLKPIVTRTAPENIYRVTRELVLYNGASPYENDPRGIPSNWLEYDSISTPQSRAYFQAGIPYSNPWLLPSNNQPPHA
ncbi:hypothetical protein HWV62_13655 [Athelia sp. TMB]|nr:hypothetical protein HWV62_13655 [Athelia sp. TMB]